MHRALFRLVHIVPRAIAVLAFPFLSGCFFPGGHCGFMPGGANWEDATLYDAMPMPGGLPGHHVLWNPPAPGLPFNVTVDETWGPHNLTRIGRASGDHLDGIEVWMEASGLRAERINRTPEADLVAELERFLGYTTALGEAEVSHYVSSLLATATNGGEYAYSRGGHGELGTVVHEIIYSAPLPGGLRLAGLWQELHSAGALLVGDESASAGAWDFQFSIPSRSVEAENGHYSLTVKAGGQAEFDGLGAGEKPEGEYEQEVRGVLRNLGLPEPVGEMDVHGSIC